MATEIGPRQLFKIARDVRDDDFAEWVERVKCRLVALGFDYPDPERLGLVLLSIAKREPRAPTPAPEPVPDARPRGSPWRIPRDRTDGGTFTPALGEPGELVTKLAAYHPDALAALKRAAASPDVKAAIARARARRKAAVAQPVAPSTPAIRELQARVMAARAAIAARKGVERDDDDDGAERDTAG